jgi:ribonucleoside-diphosphate reductase alpha chain
MTTSIIDYIFRELAVTYLGRHDLSQVSPDDLRGDALHRPAAPPRKATPTKPTPPAAGPAGGSAPIVAHGETPLPAESSSGVVSSGGGRATLTEKIRQARLKGYEGDPCPECGALTLVRSGACCKCDTCGATSGCS